MVIDDVMVIIEFESDYFGLNYDSYDGVFYQIEEKVAENINAVDVVCFMQIWDDYNGPVHPHATNVLKG